MTAAAWSLCVSVGVKIRWWVFPYLLTLRWFCMTFGTEPDFDKIVAFIVRRGVKFTVLRS